MSKELLRRGFKFVVSTICYAFMQAVGMVNDHVVDCFRYEELKNPVQRIEPIPKREIKEPRGFLKGINTEFERDEETL